jgi:TM2 domain-containing membrane protein YozV
MSTASFRIWHADGRTEDRTLGLGQHELGRSIGALVIDDPGISTRHARISVEPARVTIEDLGSSNGTLANGQRVSGAFTMAPEQPVQVGSTRIALISRSGGPPGTQLVPAFGAPPSGQYGAPPGYGHGAPPPSYGYGAGAPPPGQYGAPPPGYGAPPGYSAPPPGYGAPGPGGFAPPPVGLATWPHPGSGARPDAPFGIDPVSGEPYSDKSKLVAGLLQIFFGGLAVGRFYIGDTSTALLQLGAVWLVGVGGSFFTCGASLAVMLWPTIDGIMLLTGHHRDAQGRPLRP